MLPCMYCSMCHDWFHLLLACSTACFSVDSFFATAVNSYHIFLLVRVVSKPHGSSVVSATLASCYVVARTTVKCNQLDALGSHVSYDQLALK